jgi:hypothetical protein
VILNDYFQASDIDSQGWDFIRPALYETIPRNLGGREDAPKAQENSPTP